MVAAGERQGMDTYLAIVSKREVREYTADAVPDAALTRLLQAGRVTGSAKNRQNWEFIVIRKRATLDAVAETCSSPANLRKCGVAIAVAMHNNQRPEDGGRAAQSIMLAGWAEGIGSCPNTPMQRGACNELLGLPAEAHVSTILSLGYPDQPVPRSTDADAILSRIERKPLEEVTRYID